MFINIFKIDQKYCQNNIGTGLEYRFKYQD